MISHKLASCICLLSACCWYCELGTAVFLFQVLSVGNLHPPNVEYEYVVSLESTVKSYRWQTAQNWSECDRLCNGEATHIRPRSLPSRGPDEEAEGVH